MNLLLIIISVLFLILIFFFNKHKNYLKSKNSNPTDKFLNKPEYEFTKKFFANGSFDLCLFFNKKQIKDLSLQNDYIKVTFIDNTTYSFEGEINKNIENATAGSIWIDGEYIHYIDINKNDRIVKVDTLKILYEFDEDYIL